MKQFMNHIQTKIRQPIEIYHINLVTSTLVCMIWYHKDITQMLIKNLALDSNLSLVYSLKNHRHPLPRFHMATKLS